MKALVIASSDMAFDVKQSRWRTVTDLLPTIQESLNTALPSFQSKSGYRRKVKGILPYLFATLKVTILMFLKADAVQDLEVDTGNDLYILDSLDII